VSGAGDREAGIRDRIQQHWEASERGDIEAEHAIYAVDAILDYPQSGERFRGRSRIQAQRGGHPAERHFTIRRILGGGDFADPFPAAPGRAALAEPISAPDR
jgi:ketosteroid isomerase-like protein